MPKINSLFDRPAFAGFRCVGVSLTQQSFKAEADVNTIMARYARTGFLVDPATAGSGRSPQYGDFSSGDDFRSVQDRLVVVKTVFAALPANVRDVLGNDPANMLDLMSNPESRDDAIALGLIPADKAPSEPLSPAGQAGTGTPVVVAPAVTPEFSLTP